jgi:putative heme iron utilization protein
MTNADEGSAHALVKAGKFGALATIARSGGHPFATLVGYAIGAASAPLLLLSELAEHTQNLRVDGRASLLIVDGAADDPLAHGRVTLLGQVHECPRADAEGAYLALHPQATAFLALKDFKFWRLAVESVRYVGGFGKMGWIDGADWGLGG